MGVLYRRTDEEIAGEFGERYASLTPGVPGRCPECDGFGYIDHADLVHHTQLQHCRECGFKWEYHFDHTGTLVEVIDLTTPAETPGEKIPVIDLRDAPVQPPEEQDPEVYEQSPAEWLRRPFDR